jgi:NAD(P) transhydrogenase subunit alpha
MIIGVPKETYPGENRVAIVPSNIPELVKTGFEVIVETGAGDASGYPDRLYKEKGATIIEKRTNLYQTANVLLQVRGYCANPNAGEADFDLMQENQIMIGFMKPCSNAKYVKKISERNVATFAMELIPRISRAQSMDTLSSMMTISGYKATLLAADTLPKMFPLFMTAAGTIAPAKVLVIGAGVSGLQAIATSRRLGAVVSGYDIRPAVKEQVESLGAKFVELDLQSEKSEGKGGYAKAMGEAFYKKQRELMKAVVSDSDVVISTAAIPGRIAPVLITDDMVAAMPEGAVIIDVAAESGGNCELTERDKTVVKHGVTIVGKTNLPSTVPFHASQMYSNNITKFLLNMVKDGELDIDMDDEIVRDTLVSKDGEFLDTKVLQVIQETRKPGS